MTTILTVAHISVCLFLIIIVLLQHGKGADAGAAFGGGGSSQSLFGSEGPVPLLNKITTLSAVVFMVTSVSLAYLSSTSSTGSVMTAVPVPTASTMVEKKAEPAGETVIPMPSAETEEAAPAQEAPKAQE
ncbi:MAG TPA: preprotein translocase subunit SecG [Desulfocapsa sulfexigens]|nr:preprotein translocase subunit SecG [Desulfocapsa sulfexigens]